jgi:hypothetical protein
VVDTASAAAAVDPPVFEVDADWFGELPSDVDAGAPPRHVSSPPQLSPPAAPAALAAPAAPAVPAAPAALAAPAAPAVPALPAALADLFDALLAEEEDASGFHVRPVARSTPAPQATLISDATIDKIAERVAERLANGVLIDTVRQAVAAITERLVRDELARIRAKAQPPTS